jgi:4'-phosphopantetheinyl transferase EntD
MARFLPCRALGPKAFLCPGFASTGAFASAEAVPVLIPVDVESGPDPAHRRREPAVSSSPSSSSSSSTLTTVVVDGYGVVVVVDVDPAAAALATLPAAEQELARTFGERRRATFAAGRLALRRALVQAGVVDDVAAVGAIRRDDRGAPVLPANLVERVRVSVTHKDSHAAALVADVATLASGEAGEGHGIGHVGIDLELDEPRTRARTDGLVRQVLTPAEQAQLPDDDDGRRRALLVRFAAKEALYKAIDPVLRRYVGFLEVGVDVGEDGALAFAPPHGSGLVARGRLVNVGAGLVLALAHARSAD